jgi:hypothetical protein
MWELYSEYYENVERETFDCDLAEKGSVFVATDSGSGDLVGFSTTLFYRHEYDRTAVDIYFSGDTIIRPEYWGQSALHRSVTGALLRRKLRHPFTPLYWHLICSGYRTYLTLVRNFPRHWPHHGRETPEWEAGLIDSICRARYGEDWKAEDGVVRFGPEQPVLKAGVAPLTDRVIAMPEVRFFLRINPGYLEGDELAMIARVDYRAMAGMVYKWLRRALRRRLMRASTRAQRPEGVVCYRLGEEDRHAVRAGRR